MRELCEEYDSTRRQMKPSGARTRKMTEIFARMRSLAASVRASLPEFKSGASAGERLAAVAILQMFPSSTELRWLAERLDPNQERPLSISETYALKYWWCSPPRTGIASVRPTVWMVRGIGASLCSDRWVRASL